MLHSELFQALFITSVSITVVSTLLARTPVPSMIGFIVTGILIGPTGLGWIKSMPAAQSISELGIVFLMFSVGLEISISQLKKMIRPLLTLGLSQVIGTLGVGFLFLVLVLKLPLSSSFVMGSCLALSSTAVVLKLLSDRRETETPYGRMSLIILLFQDIAAIPMMAALPILANHNLTATSPSGFGSVVIGIPLFLLGCIILGQFVVPLIFNEITRTGSRELFFFSIFATTFVISFLAEKVGLSVSLGAFIAGVLISESPFSRQASAEITPFRDIFLGLFFASVGMMLDLKFAKANIHHLLWLIPALFYIKFSVLYAVLRRYSRSHGISFAASLALSQIGELSFVIAAAAFSYGIIGNSEFQYFLTLAIFSLLITPPLSQMGLKGSSHSSWAELARGFRLNFKKTEVAPSVLVPQESLDSPIVAPRKAIVIGLGHTGIQTLTELSKKGIPCMGLDINHANVKELHRLGIEGVFGDSTSRELLESVGVKEAFLVVVTVSGRHVVPKIISTIRLINPKVKVLARIHYIQELSELKTTDNCDIVVSETESAKAVFRKALECYGLS